MESQLTKENLDKIEKRFIKGCLGEEDIHASTLEILRKTLMANGRLEVPLETANPLQFFEEEENELPFPDPKVTSRKAN